ncbi:hypothetical protein HELRODRAFT_170344 [Helobdella robusta]|uniref:Uncharacterized protein n=1 Tax=Helobdella robusta TaxID=6412 RepID=T1F2Y2_HELRO|nr:hypothetical protein HELRODRAFT_170344 [Helobdella robusta]ESO07791.1 hypothetical protein HELRODRAFT_170344 [Helobdella robusta]
MVVVTKDREIIKNLISQALGTLCKTQLSFKSKITIDALVGVTIDHNEVLLITVKEDIDLPGCVVENKNFQRSSNHGSINCARTSLTSNSQISPFSFNNINNNNDTLSSFCDNPTNGGVLNNTCNINSNVINNHSNSVSIAGDRNSGALSFPHFKLTSSSQSNNNDVDVNILCRPNLNLVKNFFDFSKGYSNINQRVDPDHDYSLKSSITVIAPDNDGEDEEEEDEDGSFKSKRERVANVSSNDDSYVTETNNPTSTGSTNAPQDFTSPPTTNDCVSQHVKKKNIFSRLILTDKLKARQNEFESNSVFEKMNSKKKKLNLFSTRDKTTSTISNSSNNNRSLTSLSSLYYSNDTIAFHQTAADCRLYYDFISRKRKASDVLNLNIGNSDTPCLNVNDHNIDDNNNSSNNNANAVEKATDYTTVKIKTEPPDALPEISSVAAATTAAATITATTATTSTATNATAIATFNKNVDVCDADKLGSKVDDDNENGEADVNSDYNMRKYQIKDAEQDVHDDSKDSSQDDKNDVGSVIKSGVNDDKDDEGQGNSNVNSNNSEEEADDCNVSATSIRRVKFKQQQQQQQQQLQLCKFEESSSSNENDNNKGALLNLVSISKFPVPSTNLPWVDFQNMLIKSWRRNHNEDMMVKPAAILMIQMVALN